MNKGQVMEMLFTKEELKHIDVGIPIGSYPKGQSAYYVMDYNNSALGELVNMRILAHKKKIEGLPKWYPIDPYTAKVHIYFQGDRSVGIQPWSYDMTIHRQQISDDESRDWIRAEVKKLYTEMDDFICQVTFDDEDFDE